MKILALDAVTEACSAALWIDGEVEERYAVAPREHTRLILPMIDELLQQADLTPGNLDLIAFDRGPGSFTGIRVTMSVVQGLAFASDLPVLPVSSLAALAQAAWRSYGAERVLGLIDARMGELYWGEYQRYGEIMTLQGEEGVSLMENIPLCRDCHIIGSGVHIYQDALHESGYTQFIDQEWLRYPRAEFIAEQAAGRKGEAMAVENARPVYLRNKVTG